MKIGDLLPQDRWKFHKATSSINSIYRLVHAQKRDEKLTHVFYFIFLLFGDRVAETSAQYY